MLRAMTRISKTLVAMLTSGALGGCAGAQQAAPPPASAGAPMAAPAAPAVPAAIAAPAGAQVTARFHASGAQVYVCGAAPAGGSAGYAWTLKRPDATLTGDDGRPAGTHGAGPTWTSTDGSAVVGKKLAQADAPEAGAVPWLLLGAVSTTGTGVFTDVTFIQRVATMGGKAPASGCAADRVDAEEHVPYTADYFFYRGGKSQP
jgi:hypothetical protein